MIESYIPLTARAFYTSRVFNTVKNNMLLVLPSEEDAINAYKQLKFFESDQNILYFPSLDTIPYDRVSPNLNILSKRAEVLTTLAQSKSKKILVTNSINTLTKLPPASLFLNSFLKLHTKMHCSAEDLSEFLIKNGFTRNTVAIDSGEFAIRGEIVDVVLSGNIGYRINFSWDSIESIKNYDVSTQISNHNQDELIICPASEIVLTDETRNNFKNNYLKYFGVNHSNDPLYQSVIHGRKFPAYELFLPLFYNELCSIFDYFKECHVVYDQFSIPAILEHENSYNDLYQSRIQSNKLGNSSFYPALSPASFNFSSDEIITILSKQRYNDSTIKPDIVNKNQILDYKAGIVETLKQSQREKTTIIFCSSRSSIERLKTILNNEDCVAVETDTLSKAKPGIANIAHVPLSSGFSTDQYTFISEIDIFGEKFTKQRTSNSKRKLKNILIELDNFIEGEFVVHKDHGIGQFINVETIEVLGSKHDCLKILYADNNKLYVPIENIELVKKYGQHDAVLDHLGTLSWQKRKSKLKNKITDIAAKILKTAGQRKLSTVTPIEVATKEYDKFCNIFPYAETEDQLNAISDITRDLSSGQLMDRLICGDVGFGKTEVAMRAVFLVAANINDPSPQIAIICPTTILCRQHYLRFVERFKDFGFKIAELSRLVTTKEHKIIKGQLKSGDITIVIGTHALLTKDIEFNNLKLLIVDEEQHFGVSQKEYLKEFKHKLHVLSLSATPIPRTLQMSMIALKDLSLIATPPIDRLAIRTTVMQFDGVIIRDALLREHFRGGKSFYVCPRISDIVGIEKQLQEIVPELKYKVVHGSMIPQKVDEIMKEFCDGKFDILVSTTIIESGIDIAVANTMVVHKAEMLGLSQLYQLRGRIGRGKVRGYAYLTLNNKASTKYAMKRLEVIQTADTLGAGFSIASHDMDIRGFGNLVGDEQSGHIKEVGVELYQDMLDEAIAALKEENITQTRENFIPLINLGLPVFINADYIDDPNLRLGIYRRVGNLTNQEEVEVFIDEMVDRFGPLPIPFKNLLDLVKIKQICIKLNIESLDSGPQGFVVRFRKSADVSNMVFAFIKKYPRNTKITPDNKLIFIIAVSPNNIISEVNLLLEKLSS